jgi:hypothetical protein
MLSRAFLALNLDILSASTSFSPFDTFDLEYTCKWISKDSVEGWLYNKNKSKHSNLKKEYSSTIKRSRSNQIFWS